MHLFNISDWDFLFSTAFLAAIAWRRRKEEEGTLFQQEQCAWHGWQVTPVESAACGGDVAWRVWMGFSCGWQTAARAPAGPAAEASSPLLLAWNDKRFSERRRMWRNVTRPEDRAKWSPQKREKSFLDVFIWLKRLNKSSINDQSSQNKNFYYSLMVIKSYFGCCLLVCGHKLIFS